MSTLAPLVSYALLDQLQRLIDFTQRAHHLRFVGVDQFQGSFSGRSGRIRPLDSYEIERGAPDHPLEPGS